MRCLALLASTALALVLASAPSFATPVKSDAPQPAAADGAQSHEGLLNCNRCNVHASYHGNVYKKRGSGPHGDVRSALDCAEEAADALTPMGSWDFKVEPIDVGGGYGGTTVKACLRLYGATDNRGGAPEGSLLLDNFHCTNGGMARIKCRECSHGDGSSQDDSNAGGSQSDDSQDDSNSSGSLDGSVDGSADATLDGDNQMGQGQGQNAQDGQNDED